MLSRPISIFDRREDQIRTIRLSKWDALDLDLLHHLEGAEAPIERVPHDRSVLRWRYRMPT
jgi:hypothetical protein